MNLLVCDRLGRRSPSPDPEDELVRRYQQVVRPYAGRVYAAIAVVLALIAASGTIGEWQNWILFTPRRQLRGQGSRSSARTSASTSSSCRSSSSW